MEDSSVCSYELLIQSEIQVHSSIVSNLSKLRVSCRESGKLHISTMSIIMLIFKGVYTAIFSHQGDSQRQLVNHPDHLKNPRTVHQWALKGILQLKFCSLLLFRGGGQQLQSALLQQSLNTVMTQNVHRNFSNSNIWAEQSVWVRELDCDCSLKSNNKFLTNWLT